MDDDEEWVEDDAISPTIKAKVLALKVYRNRSLAHASSNIALDVSRPVLKMFATLLEHSGSFSADAADEYVPTFFPVFAFVLNLSFSPKIKSRLRLQAAVSLLHLSTVSAYGNSISADFIWLAIVVQVSVYLAANSPT
jgi:sister-chromatid-cohesion protein PDS5